VARRGSEAKGQSVIVIKNRPHIEIQPVSRDGISSMGERVRAMECKAADQPHISGRSRQCQPLRTTRMKVTSVQHSRSPAGVEVSHQAVQVFKVQAVVQAAALPGTVPAQTQSRL